MIAGRPAKILLIDSNVYFAKRLSDALKKEGFEVQSSTQPAYALTTIEYDTPTAVVCATNMREMGALEIAKIIHADPKNATLPIIALGDGSQRALMEAFQAGCEDYIDRQRPPAVIATHIRNIVISKAEGFQPTQMLPQADTSLSGSLTHHDLPGVLQMLGHAHQTGALHINAGETDALLFFDAGNIAHAECGPLFGDEAVIHIIKNCVHGAGVYKFVYGTTSSQHTVLRSATDLMLDAMREYDETVRDADAGTAEPVAPEEPPADSTEDIDLDFGSKATAPEPVAPIAAEPHEAATDASESLDLAPPGDMAFPADSASPGDSAFPSDPASPGDSAPHAPSDLVPPSTDPNELYELHDSFDVEQDIQPDVSHEPTFRPSGLPKYAADPLSLGNITERILEDLRTRSGSPVDLALAELLSHERSEGGHDSEDRDDEPIARDPDDIHQQDASDPEFQDPESADKELP